MSKELVIILLGILVALMPYLGFPGSWKSVFSIVIGIVIAGVAFIVRQERLWKEREAMSEHRADTFVENGGKHSGN